MTENNETVKPITPDDAAKKGTIPGGVIKAWNNCIERHYTSLGRSTFTQNELVEEIRQCMDIQVINGVFSVSVTEMNDKGWLDLEPLYEQNGWKIKYDRPGYNESYEAYFTFTKK